MLQPLTRGRKMEVRSNVGTCGSYAKVSASMGFQDSFFIADAQTLDAPELIPTGKTAFFMSSKTKVALVVAQKREPENAIIPLPY